MQKEPYHASRQAFAKLKRFSIVKNMISFLVDKGLSANSRMCIVSEIMRMHMVKHCCDIEYFVTYPYDNEVEYN